jgi:glycosyltransferase involved in cell wall biosynthesis
MNGRVAIVVKGYPRLSETFIAQELLSLQAKGLDFEIWALREPTDGKIHPIHREITAKVSYLPEYLYRAPLRVLGAWRRARRLAGYRQARAAWLRDLWRDPTPNRIRRFGQALMLADELPADIGWIYVHFLHTPASVTRYAAMMRRLDWSCSAHAKDIYTTPAWEKVEKLADMRWLVTCTAANVRHLSDLPGAPADKIRLLYHGLDLTRFPPPPERADGLRDGSDPAEPARLVSVGRAVPKKGYDVLLAALARLPPSSAWRLEHIGGGPELPRLKRQAERLGIADRIAWLGSRTQLEVLAAYRRSDLFVLASRVAGNGDRDGLPNVLMEALSQRLAVVATDVSALGELISDGESGRLVAPDDPVALAAAIDGLIGSPAERNRLATAGERRVRSSFAHDANLAFLVSNLVPERVAA